MTGNMVDNFSTYISRRRVRVSTAVEDQEVVTYIYTAPTAAAMPGQPGATLVDTVRTPLLEMTREEQHARVVHEVADGTDSWR